MIAASQTRARATFDYQTRLLWPQQQTALYDSSMRSHRSRGRRRRRANNKRIIAVAERLQDSQLSARRSRLR